MNTATTLHQNTSFQCLKIDLPDVGESMSRRSVNRCRGHRFRGCVSGGVEATSLPIVIEWNEGADDYSYTS